MSPENPALVTQFKGGGQIVRIYLQNFMSSDEIEVFPGMHLNLIIGPNGSGKSTLLSAVLLCLGGSLSALNKNSLSEFVKTGCDQSIIEVELFEPHGENPVIRRIITCTNQSQFFYNNRKATRNEINEIRQRYNIQVDNLCCLLSQEKVQDFAKMDRQELLRNTEMTVGNGELLTAHNKLKDLRAKQLVTQNSIKLTKDSLEKEVSKNDRLKVKVDAIKEKQALCDKLNLLNSKKHYLLYNEAEKDRQNVERLWKMAEENELKRTKEVKDIEQEIKDIEKNSLTQKEADEEAQKIECGKKAVVQERLSRMQQHLDKFSEIDGSYEIRMQEEKEKEMIVRKHKTTMDKLTNDLKDISSASQTNIALKQEDQRLVTELTRLRQEDEDLENGKYNAQEEIRTLKQEVANLERSKRVLEGVKSRRLEFLKRNDHDTYEAVMWLKDHRHEFHDHVFDPMLLEINVTDRTKVPHVESIINYNDLKAFTVTDKDDLNLLVQKLRVEKKLKINIVSAEESLNQTFHPPESMRDLRSLGFYAYLNEFVSAPREILQYLSQNYNLYKIPVGDQSVNNNASKVPSTINRFFSGDSQFTVRVSRYQNKAKATSVVKLSEPRYFSESFDENAIAAKLNELAVKLNELKNQQEIERQIIERQEKLKERAQELRKRRRELATKEEERRTVVERLERAKKELDRAQASLRNPSEINDELRRDKEKIETMLNRVKDDLKKAFEALETATHNRMKTRLLLKASMIGIEEVKSRLSATQELLREDQEKNRRMEKEYQLVENACRQARHKLKEMAGVAPNHKGFEQVLQKFASLPNTVGELEDAIQDAQSRADYVDDYSAEVLIEYRNREKEIQEIKEKLKNLDKEESVQLGMMEAERKVWLGPVKDLITKVDKTFGEHFETMKCVGEIALAEPEDPNDFDEYGVVIKVKFWDEMPLQELTRYTQSGGERTVATAIYGLSLQHLTSVPFRFVDEINQGMDARNEKSICDILSSSSALPNSPQYFYLTPKLISDFVCPENMAVLCVYNGPYVIHTSDWDVERFIRRARGEVDFEDYE